MPIVFIHGVNNRDDAAYKENELARNGFFKEIVCPVLGLNPDKVRLSSPYWGGHGVTFTWNMASLPNPSDNFERFGGNAEEEAFGRTVVVCAGSHLNSQLSVVENAKNDLPEVIDALYASAMAGAKTEEEARDLAKSYELAVSYVANNPSPAWLTTAVESNFVDQFNYEASASREEAFGAGDLLQSLKEGFSRLGNALPDAGTALAGRFARRQLNATVTRFAGDAFTYLTRRGTKDAPGDIVRIVRDALREAHASKNAEDDKLIVIAHSFGGEILYDILTYFDTQLEIDCLLTVGSQVGLFEEMKLYTQSRDDIPPNPPEGRVQKPAKLKRWMNIFDLNDVLSYRAEPIFAGVSDFSYDTGYSSFSAHGGYFMRPSFYKRLAARLKEG